MQFRVTPRCARLACSWSRNVRKEALSTMPGVATPPSRRSEREDRLGHLRRRRPPSGGSMSTKRERAGLRQLRRQSSAASGSPSAPARRRRPHLERRTCADGARGSRRHDALMQLGVGARRRAAVQRCARGHAAAVALVRHACDARRAPASPASGDGPRPPPPPPPTLGIGRLGAMPRGRRLLVGGTRAAHAREALPQLALQAANE